MNRSENFKEFISQAYRFDQAFVVGGAMYEGECVTDTLVKIPFKTLNRHGLIAGATGTGKTKTLQLLLEGLSENGIPSLVMDVKGDLSGIAAAGSANDKITERHTQIGLPFSSKGFPVELLSLSNDAGTRLRATVSEFGPVLLAKMLELNDTQSGLLNVAFKYADDNQLPLLDLKDLKRLMQHITEEGKMKFEGAYGKVSASSVGIIIRKIVELEQQGAEKFFGEISFDVNDLCRLTKQGEGYISILRITDIQDKPKLFSTFMLCLLAEIYSLFPEQGDADKPKLMLFIDEAHLIFNEASKSLLNQIETIIKLIRSKGVGVVFCTQNPTDIPVDVLSQLGFKVQHAIRAVTAKDRKAIKQIAENFPENPYYKIDELLTTLGIGQAAITVLNEKGIPTPLTATLLCAPKSRMGILSDLELKGLQSGSDLADKYNQVIDRESAFEILSGKIEKSIPEDQAKPIPKTKEEKSSFEKILANPVTRSIGKTNAREITRGLLGVLGLGSGSRKKKGSFF
jgi:DNA helicase HerA-like ATPase